MVDVPIYQIDAFTSKAFGGNPAAICPVDNFLSDQMMQSIARENNLSETAFIVARENRGDKAVVSYDLRWFTPTVEVDLCGHATLGAGYVVLKHLVPDADKVEFHTKSGPLTVERTQNRLALNLPNLLPSKVECPDGLVEALGASPDAVYHRGRDFLIIFSRPDIVESLKPDMTALQSFDPYGFIVTAACGGDVDFISRGFFPNHGIPEDPVTGSAHCLLAPYWASRLGKNHLHATQVSSRGGELWLDVSDEAVTISGHVVETMRGSIMLS